MATVLYLTKNTMVLIRCSHYFDDTKASEAKLSRLKLGIT